MTTILDLMNKAKLGSFVIEFNEDVYKFEIPNELMYAEPGMLARVYGISDTDFQVEDGCNVMLEEPLQINLTYAGFEDNNDTLENPERVSFIKEHRRDHKMDLIHLSWEFEENLCDLCFDISGFISIADDSLLDNMYKVINKGFQLSGYRHYFGWLYDTAKIIYMGKGIEFEGAEPDDNVLGWLEGEVYSHLAGSGRQVCRS